MEKGALLALVSRLLLALEKKSSGFRSKTGFGKAFGLVDVVVTFCAVALLVGLTSSDSQSDRLSLRGDAALFLAGRTLESFDG